MLLPAQTASRPEMVRSDVPLNPRTFDFESSDYNAFLLVGENALLANRANYTWVFDLGDAWRKFANTPLVLHVWCTRRGIDLRGVEKELSDTAKGNANSEDLVKKERERLGVGEGLGVVFNRILHTECGPLQISALRRYSMELARHGVVSGVSQFQVYRPPVNLRAQRMATR